MPGSLKQFITKRLKENVPLSEIKKDLQEKGYTLEQVSKAVREVIAGTDKKLPSVTIIQLGILIVGVVIAIGVAIYLTAGNKGETVQLQELCDKYTKVPNEITCNEAIQLALSKYPGTVSAVDKTQIIRKDRISGIKSSQDVWLVDLKFSTPLALPEGLTSDKGQVIVDVKTGEVSLYKVV